MNNIMEYQNLMEVLNDADKRLIKDGKADPERKEEKTRDIIAGAKRNLSVLGINALRSVHEGMEYIGKILENNGSVHVTMLDPFSETFRQREVFENAAAGRLRLEFNAAVADLADAYGRSEIVRGGLALYLHDKWPLISVVAADSDDKDGEMQLNIYPSKEGYRGLKGKTYQLSADGFQLEQDVFALCIEFLGALNANSEVVYRKDFGNVIMRNHAKWINDYVDGQYQ